jgi:hypothetical protein
LNSVDVYWLYVIGRIEPGAQPAQAQARVTAEVLQWLSDQAEIAAQDRQRIASQHVVLTPAGSGIAGNQSDYGNGLRLLMVASLLVLLIACANIANLLLARIGIRMSLGAGRGNVIAMMLRSAMTPIGLGLVIGILVAVASGGLIASQLYGVKSYDPLVMLVAIVVLVFSAVLAAIVPARRAASIDPIRALRTE